MPEEGPETAQEPENLKPENPNASPMVVIVPRGGLEFRGEGGELLLALMPLPGGGAALHLMNAQGLGVVRMDSGGPDGFLSVESSGGAVQLGVSEAGGVCTVLNPAGSAVARMACGVSGGQVSVADNARRARSEMRVIDGAGHVTVCNQAGEYVGALGVADEDGGLLIKDRALRTVFAVPAWKYASTSDAKEPE